MHAVYFAISKTYTHGNIKQPTWLMNIGVTEKRSWGRLGMSERSLRPRVKNIALRTCRERHTGSFFLKPTALLWEINAMKLHVPALMDKPNFCRIYSMQAMYDWCVRLTSLTLICWQVNERKEDQINVASLQVLNHQLFL